MSDIFSTKLSIYLELSWGFNLSSPNGFSFRVTNSYFLYLLCRKYYSPSLSDVHARPSVVFSMSICLAARTPKLFRVFMGHTT